MNLVGKILLGFKEETALARAVASGRDFVVKWGCCSLLLSAFWYAAHVALNSHPFAFVSHVLELQVFE